MKNETHNLLKGYNMLLYFTGSMIMSEPTEECVIDFWASGSLKRLPVTSSNPKFVKASAVLRDECSDKDYCRRMLADDYSRLFAENGTLLAPANSSAYSVMSMQKKQDSPEYFYQSFGWNNVYMNKPADHLGVELLFLTKLIEKYLLLDDIPCRNEMKREISFYIKSCLLPWIPAWNDKVQENAQTTLYKGIGLLILSCVEDLYGIFSSSEDRYNN
jgi:TorA maturation chaperone TorD